MKNSKLDAGKIQILQRNARKQIEDEVFNETEVEISDIVKSIETLNLKQDAEFLELEEEFNQKKLAQ